MAGLNKPGNSILRCRKAQAKTAEQSGDDFRAAGGVGDDFRAAGGVGCFRRVSTLRSRCGVLSDVPLDPPRVGKNIFFKSNFFKYVISAQICY